MHLLAKSLKVGCGLAGLVKLVDRTVLMHHPTHRMRVLNPVGRKLQANKAINGLATGGRHA